MKVIIIIITMQAKMTISLYGCDDIILNIITLANNFNYINSYYEVGRCYLSASITICSLESICSGFNGAKRNLIR